MNSMMNVGISILNPSDEPAWQDYVNSHPDATIYHTLEWRDILYNEYGFEPVYLIAWGTNPPLSPFSKGGDKSFPPLTKGGEGGFLREGKVVGILPMFLIKNLRGKRLVSLPFSIYGGPIGETGEIVFALLSKAIRMVQERRAVSLEIKLSKLIDVDIPDLKTLDWGIGTAIDLTVGVDALWKGLSDRNDVNRAVRERLVFSISDSEFLDRFYKLQLMTRKRLGLPVPSLMYYRSFFEKMPGLVKLGLVEREGTPVAGGLFFVHKSTILYALGASDYRYLSSRPNDLLIWEMMKWGCENGFKAFDLGTTQMNDRGLTHFKEKWGGKEALVERYFYPAVQKMSNREGSVFLKMLPLPISKVVGPKMIRCLG